MSVGRGTDRPFRIFGHPDYLVGSYHFTPRSIPGVSEHPPYEGSQCYGADVSGLADDIMNNERHFTISYLIQARKVFPDSVKYFNSYFDKLSGNSGLREKILNGTDEETIRRSWDQDLEKFRTIRSKYLLYPDFE
jgi:uncharacterized protein YbbC (DUF1343 family)